MLKHCLGAIRDEDCNNQKMGVGMPLREERHVESLESRGDCRPRDCRRRAPIILAGGCRSLPKRVAKLSVVRTVCPHVRCQRMISQVLASRLIIGGLLGGGAVAWFYRRSFSQEQVRHIVRSSQRSVISAVSYTRGSGRQNTLFCYMSCCFVAPTLTCCEF